MKIKGVFETRRVWIDGKELFPEKSLQVRNHSPSGFNWGYAGSGPAQLALAILLEVIPRDYAERLYQDFKFDFIAKLPQADFEREIDLEAWVNAKTPEGIPKGLALYQWQPEPARAEPGEKEDLEGFRKYYEVGERFPSEINMEGLQGGVGATWRISGKSFEIVFLVQSPSVQEIDDFRKGPFKFGVLELANIPIFLMKFDSGLSFELFFNIALEREAGRELQDFLYSDANLVTLFLVDSVTFILWGIRALGMPPETIRRLKESCRGQLAKYQNAGEAAAVIQFLMSKYTHKDLISLADLRRLPKPKGGGA